MADLTTSAYTRTYTSFSGVDIVAVIDNIQIGEIQGISYSITREKAPVYTMGSADPRSFSRGKRGIAGSMVFILFDRHALTNVMQASLYVAKTDENAVRQSDFGLAPKPVDQTDPNAVAFLGTPQYADQIPPFDISLSGANELGQIMSMSIQGAEFLNEGSGISVDDIVNEMAFTYVARRVVPWKPYSAGATGIDIIDLGGAVNLADIPALTQTAQP
jgi:hypothetical protein